MKICPSCAKRYQDEMNYCLEDGEILKIAASSGAENTLPYSSPAGFVTDADERRETRGAPNDFDQTRQKTEVLPAKPKFRFIFGVLLIGFGLFFGILIYASFVMFRSIKTSGENLANGGNNVKTISSVPSPTFNPTVAPPDATPKVKIEIQERVKDSFNANYIKCQITNAGETVIEQPTVTLTLYKNDVKLGNISETSPLKFLKPNQTIPIWVANYLDDKYTSAVVDETVKPQSARKKSADLFPSLLYTDLKMSSDKRVSSYNGHLYNEMFYVVTGKIENRQYDDIKPVVYVVFYDQNQNFIGVATTYPPNLKKNEKAELTATVGRTSLFGVPASYELIVTDE